MAQFASALRRGLALAGAVLLLASCGRSAQREAELSAAPVRRVVAALSQSPAWQPGRCLCVGQFTGDAVQDFPPGLLTAEFAAHKWVRNWSECAPNYGRVKGLAQCPRGMSDYICSTSEAAGLPSGTTRVQCHVNGKNELLFDEYNVSRRGGQFVAHPVSLNATRKLKTVETPDE